MPWRGDSSVSFVLRDRAIFIRGVLVSRIAAGSKPDLGAGFQWEPRARGAMIFRAAG
jgi:hypothetical protein